VFGAAGKEDRAAFGRWSERLVVVVLRMYVGVCACD